MLDIRPVDLSREGLERTVQLLNVVFPTAKHVTVDYLDRLYNGNPLGETFGLAGWDNGELIGHYLMIPIRATIFGKEEPGIWPFQLATHPNNRNKGLFSALVETSFDITRDRGFTFHSGVGNANSTPIFVKKWGYQSICQLDVKLGVGLPPPSRIDGGTELYRNWDKASVAWRLQHAAEPYRVKYDGDVGHLYAHTGKMGIWVEIGAFPRSMLPPDLKPLRTPSPFRLFIGADKTRDWSRSTYMDVPHRYRPSPLNLLFHDLTGQKRRFDPSRVRYDVFDFDAY